MKISWELLSCITLHVHADGYGDYLQRVEDSVVWFICGNAYQTIVLVSL